MEENGPEGGYISNSTRDRKKKFLEEKIKHFIDDFDNKRSYNRRATIIIRISIILAGALTTIILGLKSSGAIQSHEKISDIALILTSLITAVSAWDLFSDYNTKWITYRTALYLLFRIRDDFEFEANEPGFPTDEQAEKFYEWIEAIVEDANQKWLSSRLRVDSARVASGSKPS